jgi:predicted dehydrogenase
VELVGVVTRSPQRRAELALDHPGVPAFDALSDLLAPGVDAVTITAPPQTRRDLVLEALADGVHVVADKPFPPSADAGRDLVRAAEEAGVALNVFHNRRWDADIHTQAPVLRRDEVGELWRVESRLDLDDPATLEAGPHGGLLRTSAVTPWTRCCPCWVRAAACTPSSTSWTFRGAHRLRLHVVITHADGSNRTSAPRT